MIQHNSNLKSCSGILVLLAMFTACNSGRPVEKIADTASTPAYSSPVDTMQPNMSTDTAAMPSVSDTAAMQSAGKPAIAVSKK